MRITDLKPELKELIAKGKNDLALKRLIKIANSQSDDISNMIYSLSSSFEMHKRKLILGTITEDNRKKIENELSIRFLNIVDKLEEDPNALSQKRNYSKLILPICAAIVFALGFYYFNWMKNDTLQKKEVNYTQLWLGEWNHKLYSNKNPDLITKGKIKFQQKENHLTGTGELIYPAVNSPTAKLRLENITVNQSSMTGNWSTDLIDHNNPQKGAFEFVLSDDHQSFTGIYNLLKQKNVEHQWNGKKIN